MKEAEAIAMEALEKRVAGLEELEKLQCTINVHVGEILTRIYIPEKKEGDNNNGTSTE